MADISKLRGIRSDEPAKFREARISTVEELWGRLAADGSGAVGRLASQTRIEEERLTQLLAAQGDEVRGLERYVIPVAALALLGIVAVALLAGVSALGSNDLVVIAARDLESGRVLRPDDLSSTSLRPGKDYFASSEVLDGLVLARGVSVGGPLRHADVLRPQVAAVKDLPAGAVIASDAVKPVWSTFQPEAALRMDQVVGRPLRRAVRRDQVIFSSLLDPVPTPALAQQVVVRATAGLPPYHVLGAEDVTLTVTPKETAALTSLDAAVDRYALHALPRGAVLRSSDVSGVRLQAGLKGRQILSIPIEAGTLSAAIVPGARVSLLFSPRHHVVPVSTPRTMPHILDDAIILSIGRQGGAVSLVAAVTEEDLQAVLPLLGTSDVFASQPAP